MADDYTGNIFTTGLLGIGTGGQASGVIEIRGDTDWFKISLTQGTTYKFTLGGRLPVVSNNSMLALYDPNGKILDIKIGNATDIRVTIPQFTATATANYFLEARDLFSAVGGYTISTEIVRNPILGTSNSDNLIGTSAADNIVGQAGNDVLVGLAGNDYLFGDSGDDRFDGGAGQNYIYGGDGTDTVAYPFDLQDYAMSRNPKSGTVEINHKSGGSDNVFEVENIEARNGTLNVSELKYWGRFTDEQPGSGSSVFRFFNTRDQAFFYTSSVAERDMIVSNSSPTKNNVDEWPYVYQGSTFEAAHKFTTSTPLFRFYNTQTGHHFFTASRDEADYVRSQSLKGAWPFKDEGIAYNVYTNKPSAAGFLEITEVRRFYSPSLDRHFFTASSSEIEAIRLTGVWNDEGIAFFAESPGGG